MLVRAAPLLTCLAFWPSAGAQSHGAQPAVAPDAPGTRIIVAPAPAPRMDAGGQPPRRPRPGEVSGAFDPPVQSEGGEARPSAPPAAYNPESDPTFRYGLLALGVAVALVGWNRGRVRSSASAGARGADRRPAPEVILGRPPADRAARPRFVGHGPPARPPESRSGGSGGKAPRPNRSVPPGRR